MICGLDGTVRGRPAVRGHRGPVRSGDYLVAGGGANGGTPSVYSLSTTKKVGGLKGHKSMLGGLASLESGAVVTGGMSTSNKGDRTVRIWDVAGQKEAVRMKISGISRSIVGRKYGYAATWLHEPGNRLLSFDEQGEVRWEEALHSEPAIAVSLKEDVLFVFLPGGTVFLDESGAQTYAYAPGARQEEHPSVFELRDPKTGKVKSSTPRPAALDGVRYLTSPQFSADGAHVLLNAHMDDASIKAAVWDVKTNRFTGFIEGVSFLGPWGAQGQLAGWTKEGFCLFEASLLKNEKRSNARGATSRA